MSLKFLNRIKTLNVANENGFTILELMFTLVIAATLVSLAVPSFRTMMRDGRTTAVFNRFMGDIAYARSEAVKRGTNIMLCPATDANGCTGADWSTGWIAFIDDGANSRAYDAGEEVVRVGASTRNQVSITASGFLANNAILLSRDGSIEAGLAANIGRFTICDDQGDVAKAKGITFSVFGQMRQMTDTNGTDVVDYEDGGTTDVVCL